MVSDDELLRLARMVWPQAGDDLAVGATQDDDHVCVNSDRLGPLLSVRYHPRAREALHAALLVLAGEESPAARIARLEGQLEGLDDCFRGQIDAEAVRDELHALRGKP